MPTNYPDLLNPGLPENLKRVGIPTVDATPDSLEGYGFLVDSPEDIQIEIERSIVDPHPISELSLMITQPICGYLKFLSFFGKKPKPFFPIEQPSNI